MAKGDADFPEFDSLFQTIQPQYKFLRYRQGSDPLIWSKPGTKNYALSASVLAQVGVMEWTGLAATSGSFDIVTFPVRYPSGASPLIIACANGDYSAVMVCPRADDEMLEMNWFSLDGAPYTRVRAHWLAIGPA